MAEMLVCRDGDMAEGGVRIVKAGKIEIGVIRHDGKYYAYRNHCPHQGGPACEGLRMPQVKELVDENGMFHGKTFDETDMHIVCPWHGYEFHLSDGYHVADRRLRLQKFDVIERDGEILCRSLSRPARRSKRLRARSPRSAPMRSKRTGWATSPTIRSGRSLPAW